MAGFPLQRQGYCFNFVLKLLFGYEIHLIPHTICHNSHLNWGINNQPFFTCRGMQLLPSFNERCQLHPNPLLFLSKEIWFTPLIYNLIVYIWAISCLSNICNFSPLFLKLIQELYRKFTNQSLQLYFYNFVLLIILRMCYPEIVP